MVQYKLIIDGTERDFLSLKYTDYETYENIPTWEAVLAYVDEAVSMGDLVYIKRKGNGDSDFVTKFAGIVEYEEPSTTSSGLRTKKIGGRHIAVYLWRKWAERMEDPDGYWSGYYPHKIIQFLCRRIRSEKPSLVEDKTWTRVGWGIRPDKAGDQWSVTVSSTGSGHRSHIIGRNNVLGWTSSGSDQNGEYFEIDLGRLRKNIVAVRIENRYDNYYARGYKIEVSPDGTNYYTVASMALNKARNIVESWNWSDLPTSPVNYQNGIRYIRFTATRTTTFPLSVYEAYVYEAPDGEISGISIGSMEVYLPFNCSEVTENASSSSTTIKVRHGWKFKEGDEVIIADEAGNETTKEIAGIIDDGNTLVFSSAIGFTVDTDNNPWVANMDNLHAPKVSLTYKRRSDAITEITKMCVGEDNKSWVWWVEPNGDVRLASSRGSDLSSTVSFVSSTNISSSTHKQDYRTKVDVINVLGASSSKDSTAQDRNSSGWVGSGEYEYVQVDKSVTSEEAAKSLAYQILDQYDDVVDLVKAEVYDTYPTNTWGPGDIITITDAHTGISGSYRVTSVTVTFDGASGERTQIEANSKEFTIAEYIHGTSNRLMDSVLHQTYVDRVNSLYASHETGYPEFIYFFEAEKMSVDYEDGSGSVVVQDDSASGGAYVKRTQTSNSGYLIRGPGLSLKAGRYMAVFKLASSSVSSDLTLCQLRIYSETYGGNIATKDLSPSDFASANVFQAFQLTFSSDVDYDDYEFMVYFNNGIAELKVDWVGIVYAGTGTIEDIDLDYPEGAPATPTGLNVSGKPNAILLQWNANSEQDLDHYNVYVNTVNDYSTATLVASVMATTYLYSASTSEYGETLYFWVTAVDIVGNESNPTSSVNESVPHVEPEDLAIEQRDWKSDISFKWDSDNQDYDKVWWGKAGSENDTNATITFSDGTENQIVYGQDDGLSDGVYYYYWDETHTDVNGYYILQRTTVYSNAVGSGKGLVALVQINSAENAAPDIILFSGYLSSIGAGVLSAYAIKSKHISADWITGKYFRTSGRESNLAGIEFFDDGIFLYNDSNNEVLTLDTDSGSVKLYGANGAFKIYDDDFPSPTQIGELRAGASTIHLHGLPGMTVQLTTDSGASVSVTDYTSGSVILSAGSSGNVVVNAGSASGSIQLKSNVTPGGTASTIGTASEKFVAGYFNSIYLSTTCYPTADEHAATKKYVDQLFASGVSYLEPVISFWDAASGLPSSPSNGDRYIASSSGNGWTEDYVYEYVASSSSWDEYVPSTNDTVWVEEESSTYNYNGSDWILISSTAEHNNLSGLQGGTTDQYYHLTLSDYNLITSGVLHDIANITPSDGVFIVGNGTTWTGESGVTARSSLGLGPSDSPTFADITLSSPSSIYSLNHDSFNGFIANEHIDHTSVSIATSYPLNGGGTIDSTRTISLLYDASDLGLNTSHQLYVKDSGIDHDSTANVHQDVNTSASPTFVSLTLSGVSSASPVSTDGLLFVDESDSKKVKRYDFGSIPVSIFLDDGYYMTSSTVFQGLKDQSGNSITWEAGTNRSIIKGDGTYIDALQDGTNPYELKISLSISAVDSRYVNVSGDTISGDLNFDDAGTTSYQVAFNEGTTFWYVWADSSNLYLSTTSRTGVPSDGIAIGSTGGTLYGNWIIGSLNASTLKLSGTDINDIFVPQTRNIIAGTGLSGGGSLSSDITLSADTSVIMTLNTNQNITASYKRWEDDRFIQIGEDVSGNGRFGIWYDSSDIQFQIVYDPDSAGGGISRLLAANNTQIFLYYDDTLRLSTTGSGVNISGNLSVNGTDIDDLYDNYDYWTISDDKSNTENVLSTNTITFDGSNYIDTTYNTTTNTMSITHTDPGGSSTNNSGTTVIQNVSVSLGHITGTDSIDLSSYFDNYVYWIISDNQATPNTENITSGFTLKFGSSNNTISVIYNPIDNIMDINHYDPSPPNSTSNSGVTVIQNIDIDALGHLTGSIDTIDLSNEFDKYLYWTISDDKANSENILSTNTITFDGSNYIDVTYNPTSNTMAISHTNPGGSSTNNSGTTVLQNITISLGHVTGADSVDLSTYFDKYSYWTISDNQATPNTENITSGFTLKFGSSNDTISILYNTTDNMLDLNHYDPNPPSSTSNSGLVVIQNVDIDALGHFTGSIDTIDLSGQFDNYSYWTISDSESTPNTENITAGFTLKFGSSNGTISAIYNPTTNTMDLNHYDVNAPASTNNTGVTVIQNIDVDALGHLTGSIDTIDLSGQFLQASGDTMTGNLNMSGNDIVNIGDLSVGLNIQHYGDADTTITFGTNTIDLYAGGNKLFEVYYNNTLGEGYAILYNQSGESIRTITDGIYFGGDSTLYIIGDASNRDLELYSTNGDIELHASKQITIFNDIIPNGSHNIGSTTDKIDEVWANELHGDVYYADFLIKDLYCYNCGEPFEVGEEIVMVIKGMFDHDSEGTVLRAVPVHRHCRLRKLKKTFKRIKKLFNIGK